MTRVRSFWDELRRRHVVRVGIAYVVVAVAVGSAAEVFLPGLGAPEWVLRTVLGLLVLGLPLALVMAWAYDITPEGIERAGPSEGGSIAPSIAMEGAPKGPSAVKPADTRRLAILPFANIHADRDEDYFADGMTEELISVISRIHGLDVIARTSVMAYRDTTKSVTEIGRELNVGSVLEGSVRKAGDQLRITAQLIDVGTQGHLWSSDYDREMHQIFEVQSDIARQVATALEIALLGAEERGIDRAPTENLEAYDLYLLGRHYLNKRTDTGVRRAIEHFEKAAGLDPTFAQAFAGLADAYVLAALGYAAIPDAISLSGEAATQALELDSELAEAHTSLGYMALNRDWDWGTAERAFARAIELNPSDAQAHQWYAHLALYRRQVVEADRRFDRARQLDPLSVVILNESGWPAWFRRDFDEALGWFQRAEAADPLFAMAHFNQGNYYDARGQLEEAIARFRRAVELSNRVPVILANLAGALARSGQREEARELLREIEAMGEQGAAINGLLAWIHDGLGQREEALRFLEQGLAAREPTLVYLYFVADPPMTSLASEPRYLEIRREVRELLAMEDWPTGG